MSFKWISVLRWQSMHYIFTRWCMNGGAAQRALWSCQTSRSFAPRLIWAACSASCSPTPTLNRLDTLTFSYWAKSVFIHPSIVSLLLTQTDLGAFSVPINQSTRLKLTGNISAQLIGHLNGSTFPSFIGHKTVYLNKTWLLQDLTFVIAY